MRGGGKLCAHGEIKVFTGMQVNGFGGFDGGVGADVVIGQRHDVFGCAEAAAADIRIGGRRVGGKRGGLGGFKVDAACAAGQMAGIELHVAVGQDADVLLGAEGAVVLQVVAALAAV